MKYRFTENEDVAHIDNLSLKMTVREIRYVKIKVRSNGEGYKKRLRDILCYWWDDRRLMEGAFQSERLVPWEYACQGKPVCEKWLEEMGAKQYKI